MEQNINILIADDNQELGDLLKKNLGEHKDFSILGVTANGLETLEMVRLTKPDIVLLDIIMPGIDGICVLERVRPEGICEKTSFIVVSAAGQDSVIKKAIMLGADYYLLKPFQMDVLVRRIRQVYYEKKGCDRRRTPDRNQWYWHRQNLIEHETNIDIRITRIIKKMGILPNIIGYYYLHEAILRVITEPGNSGSVTRMLYPAVAEKFGTTPRKIERSIRNAIKVSWEKGSRELRKTYVRKPTNAEFICSIAEWIRLYIG